MALTLKMYQKRALASLESYLDDARLKGPIQAFEGNVDKGLLNHYKPMPGQRDVPYVCLRIPTGGGKTVMGAHIIKAASRTILEREYPLILWMVPTSQIKSQTLDAFRNPRHPYREELDETFGGQVAIFDVADFAQIRPADLGTKVCMVVGTVAALRVTDKEGRKVYEHHEDLEPHFPTSIAELDYLDKGATGKALASFANLLKLHGPLIIMDEAHNATTALSYEVYERLGPKAVVELTATPDTSSSNVLVSVSAFELKDENMIKFPVVLKEHAGQWEVAVNSAVARRNALAKTALGEPDYIRPLLLIQAENAKGTATVEQVKKHLVEVEKIPEQAIAIATGDQRGIDGVDLFAKNCHIEIIITKQALKEGWDCSFAYVFCSVAQVKSDKDIQQLLGRVLRMPYASARKLPEMSKAYAHVITEKFGAVAGELIDALVDIGFNPMEAASGIRPAPRSEDLNLQGGSSNPISVPVVRVHVIREPDLSSAPARDQQRVLFVPNQDGKGGVVEVVGEVDSATNEAIVEAVPVKQREETQEKLRRHQMVAVAAKAPSENGAVFIVPRLCMVEQGELEFIDRGMVEADFAWDLLASPPDLLGFRFNDESKTFEVDLDGRSVSYHLIKDDVATYLPGFSQDRTATDLIGWLDHEIRDHTIKQPVLREWLRRSVDGLLDRGFSLEQLLKGQFVLRRKLSEQLEAAKTAAYKQGFQQALFGGGLEIVTSDGPDHAYTYMADMTAYPAHYYYQGPYRFEKHYYPVPGDLNWKTSKGKVTEEFDCAQAIDLLDEVDFWVRNLVHPSQFWMPTSKMRTYPDFVARLNDGRLLVVEYKGGDRFTADQEKEKRLIGQLWANSSGGKGVYLMAQMKDDKGRGLTDQLKAAIGA